MDPIRPILSGPAAIPSRPPVQPLERITRERDRPDARSQQRKRPKPPDSENDDPPEEPGGGHHIDVRA
jgi:hypothetical protein